LKERKEEMDIEINKMKIVGASKEEVRDLWKCKTKVVNFIYS